MSALEREHRGLKSDIARCLLCANTDSCSAAKLRECHQRHVHLWIRMGDTSPAVAMFSSEQHFNGQQKIGSKLVSVSASCRACTNTVVHATCVDRRLWAHSFSHRRLWRAHSFSGRRLWASLHGWELRMKPDCYNSLRFGCRCSWIH